MGRQGNGKLVAYLPLVFAVTFAVVLAPMLVVLWLRESGAVSSMWVALAIGVVMSLAASQLGAVLWKSKANSELLFNELMLWGWVQRWRSERRLAAATSLLGLSAGRPRSTTGEHLSGEEKQRSAHSAHVQPRVQRSLHPRPLAPGCPARGEHRQANGHVALGRSPRSARRARCTTWARWKLPPRCCIRRGA